MPALRTRDTPSQSLEVITDTILPPTLAIVSPTPRAAAFPFNQTETSPYSSPIASPFEPDLRKLALSPSHPALIRTLSPVSPLETTSSCTSVFSTTPSTTSFATTPSSPHKRRKSSICSDIERRPKKGDDDYIKRPENAFILFRRKCCEDRQAAQEEAAVLDGPAKKQRQADLSKTISQQWKALSSEERLYWEELAKEKKKEHEQMYPNYVYRPQRTKDRKGKKGKRGEEDSESTISFVLPLGAPATGKNHGRSSSAPTPPPRQTIQIPSVYMPSCPRSPSMVPMINRRASHPDHGSSSSSQFDFTGLNTAMPSQQYSPSDAFPGVNVASLYIGTPENSHPLSSDMSMHVVHQMGSPVSSASSVSGPSSPASATFPHLNCSPTELSYPIGPCDELGPHMQAGPFCGGPLDNLHLGYPPCSWDTAGAWGSQNQMLVGDEFDMSAIPPVELGIPGCGDEILSAPCGTFSMGYAPGPYDPMVIDSSQYSTESQCQDTFEQLFNFEGMLAAHHGY